MIIDSYRFFDNYQFYQKLSEEKKRSEGELQGTLANQITVLLCSTGGPKQSEIIILRIFPLKKLIRARCRWKHLLNKPE